MPFDKTHHYSEYWLYLEGETDFRFALTPDEIGVLDKLRANIDRIENDKREGLRQLILRQVKALASVFGNENKRIYDKHGVVVETREILKKHMWEDKLAQPFVSSLSILFQIDDEVYGDAWTKDLSDGDANSGKRTE